MSTTRITIDIEIDNLIFDLEEAQIETSFMIHKTLIQDLLQVGDICRCRVLASQMTRKEVDHGGVAPSITDLETKRASQ